MNSSQVVRGTAFQQPVDGHDFTPTRSEAPLLSIMENTFQINNCELFSTFQKTSLIATHCCGGAKTC